MAHLKLFEEQGAPRLVEKGGGRIVLATIVLVSSLLFVLVLQWTHQAPPRKSVVDPTRTERYAKAHRMWDALAGGTWWHRLPGRRSIRHLHPVAWAFPVALL
jgi:hypothetical protein